MNEEVNPYQSPPEYSDQEEIFSDVNDPGADRQFLLLSFKSGHVKAVWAMRLLWFTLILKVCNIAVLFNTINLLSQSDFDAEWTKKAELNDLCLNGISIMTLLTFFASAITFISWFYRVRKNLPALGTPNPQYALGWTIGGWFVPIMNLFRPYQVMAEVWTGSLVIKQKDDGSFEDEPRSPVGLWWAAWIIMQLSNQLVTRISAYADTIDSVISVNWVAIVASCISIIAALLAITTIKRIDKNQALRYEIMADMSDAEDQQQLQW